MRTRSPESALDPRLRSRSAPYWSRRHNACYGELSIAGDPEPSPEDIALTRRIAQGAQLLGIRLLDHVIVTEESHYSFFDAGQMP